MTVANPSITKSGMAGRVQALWAYRTFVTSMVARELRARYMGSLLGGLWALITPLVLILIYMLVFSEVMRGKLADGSGKLTVESDPLPFSSRIWRLYRRKNSFFEPVEMSLNPSERSCTTG